MVSGGNKIISIMIIAVFFFSQIPLYYAAEEEGAGENAIVPREVQPEAVEPMWGGKDPKSAGRINFDDNNFETYTAGDQNRDNWYYTTTSKKGNLIFEIKGISRDNLDLYVYDYQVTLLCKSTNLGKNNEKCILPKSTTTEWKFYIKVVPVGVGALGTTATLYFHAEEAICKFTEASWGKTTATEGDSVPLTVKGNSYCDGKTISFQVKEDDDLDSDDNAERNPNSKTMSNGQATSTWTAEWQNDCNGGCNPPEWYFTASASGADNIQSPANLQTYNLCTDKDGDKYYTQSDCGTKIDCNDDDAAINPGKNEVCDGKDNNCDGNVDENVKTNYYKDGDGDGYGSSSDTKNECSKPSGYVTNKDDCNDNDANMNPGKSEVCDNKDNDCDGKTDEDLTVYSFYKDGDKDGYGNPSDSISICVNTPPVNYVNNNKDCDDKDAEVNPSKSEVCDNKDNNCNGKTDEELFQQQDCGVGVCAGGIQTKTCSAGNWPQNWGKCSTQHKAITEGCDGLDNDCNGKTDETFDKQNDVNNCGSCKLVCSFSNAAPKCSSGVCEINLCSAGYNNCDGSKANGCEINTQTDVDNCGACSKVCAFANANPACSSGACSINSCKTGYASCDDQSNNGCEVNTQTDVNNCGGCGVKCSFTNANAQCSSSTCGIASCKTGYADCDGNKGNGCEKSTQDDINNCGGCGVKCSQNQECNAGVCKKVLVCGDGVCDSDEYCAKDCLRINKITPPLTINEGQATDVKVDVENLGNIPMSDFIELGLVPSTWSTKVAAKPVESSVIIDAAECCQENEYYQAKSVKLNGKESATITFTLKAPSKSSINHCGEANTAWGESFYFIAGFYEKCAKDGGAGYDAVLKKGSIAVTPKPICNNNGVCEQGETQANCPNDCKPSVCNKDGFCTNQETHGLCPLECQCDVNSDCSANYQCTAHTCIQIPSDQEKCKIPDGSSSSCDCNSNRDCPKDYECKQRGGYDPCLPIVYNDECSNHDKYFCVDGWVKYCVNNGKYWDVRSIQSCTGKYQYCNTANVNSIKACSTSPNKLDAWVDYADSGVKINKQNGDVLKINIQSEQSISINIQYDANVFQGNCPSQFNVNAGLNTCQLTVKSSRTGKQNIKVADKIISINVIKDPDFMIITDSKKLFERFPGDEKATSILLKKAYAMAADNGVVYDLSQYSFSTRNPFSSIGAYNEGITKPSMINNIYSLEIAKFIKNKCMDCQDIMVLGDDYVVPHTRVNPTLQSLDYGIFDIYEKEIYSDSYYIPRSFDRTFADLDEVFASKVDDKLEQGKVLKIIVPPTMTEEQKQALATLEQTLNSKFNPKISEIKPQSVACNQVQFFDSLKGATVIIIGTTDSNPAALKCYPFLVESETKATIFIDINQWDNKENVVIIGSDHPNAIYAFNDIVANGMYRDIDAKSLTLLDVGVGIGAGIVIVGGVAATIAGAPIVAGAFVIGGVAVAGTSIANECVVKNYGGNNWGWCTFDVSTTFVGGAAIEKVAGPVIRKGLSPAMKPFLENAGFKKAFSFALDLNPKKAIKILDESLASGQLEWLGKMIAKLSPSELSNTAKYVNLWDGNAFKNVDSQHDLVRIFDSKHTSIRLINGEIKNAAVLREGLQTGNDAIDLGMAHIRVRHVGISATATKFEKVVNGQKFLMNEAEVMDLIDEALEKGVVDTLHNTEPERVALIYYAKTGLSRKGIRVVMDKRTGEVITSYLTNEGG